MGGLAKDIMDPDTVFDAGAFFEFAKNDFSKLKLLEDCSIRHSIYGDGKIIKIEKWPKLSFWVIFERPINGHSAARFYHWQFGREFTCLSLPPSLARIFQAYQLNIGVEWEQRNKGAVAAADRRFQERQNRKQKEAAKPSTSIEKKPAKPDQRMPKTLPTPRSKQNNPEIILTHVNCPYCNVLIVAGRLKSHINKRCPKNPAAHSTSKNSHDTIKMVRGFVVTKSSQDSLAGTGKVPSKQKKIHWRRSSGGAVVQTSMRTMKVGRRRGAVIRRKSY